jgi:hypothetical protein
MNELLKSGALPLQVEVVMKKLHFLILFIGGLAILGCQLFTSGSEDKEDTVQVELTVTASPSDGGIVIRSPNQTQYELGTVVTLTAQPASGYQARPRSEGLNR